MRLGATYGREALRLSLLKAGRRPLEAMTVKVTLHISIRVTRTVWGTGYLLSLRYWTP